MPQPSPTTKKKRRPPTPVRKLTIREEQEDIMDATKNIEENSQEDINSYQQSQKDASNHNNTDTNHLESDSLKMNNNMMHPLNKPSSSQRRQRMSYQNLRIDVPQKIAQTTLHRKTQTHDSRQMEALELPHSQQSQLQITNAGASRPRLHGPSISNQMSTFNTDHQAKSKAKKFQELMNGGFDRQNQLELLKTRFDKGIGQGTKYFEAQMQRNRRKSKTKRIVMF
jgi:hypothetical protein